MYVPLNIKTDNYLQSSMISVNKLIYFAINNNIKALTITDNNMYGVIDFYKACKKNNIKPIIGLDISINDNHIILYAKSYIGYLNLVKLSTLQSEMRIDIHNLYTYAKDLIAIIPYDYIELYDKLKDAFKELFVSYKDDDEKNNINVAKVYMNCILCLNKSDTKYLKYLEAIKEGMSLKFIDTNYSDNYLKLEQEVIKDDLNNNIYIYENCNCEILFNNNLMPVFNNDFNVSSFDYLKKLCINGAKKRFGSKIGRIYQERLKYELSIINRMGFSDYFLIVQDYVNYAKENNIIVGTGRGSAVSSLVAYLLNITDVDPLKYNLLFERFLNPERVSMPDIDIDFEHDKRDQVINYCIKKYGKKKVAPIIAFGTLGCKAAIRDVGRCLDIDLKQIDSLCRILDSNISLKDNYNKNKKLQEFLNRKKDLFNLYKDATHFEGLKRHTTIHAAGIVMSNTNLDNIIPLAMHDNFYTSGYDMTYLEEIGLLKMDFLAIKYLTIIHNIIDLVNKNYNVSLKFDEIKMDNDSIDIFRNADTLGIFQFESAGMINFLTKLKPDCFDDIIASIALYRPGPMKNIDTYINRKNKKEKIDYIHDSLKDVLAPTYGIIIYQEQIMQIAQIMADYTLGEADILRKAMSKKKKDLIESQKDTFKERSLKKGYDEVTINKVFELMVRFAEYGFNKSHSVGYSMVSVKMAYLKAHYRKEFYLSLLESDKGSKEKVKQYIYELRKNGIDIINPDINLSLDKYYINDNKIVYPLSYIKGLNINIALNIIEERKKGDFKDIFDFISRCYNKNINKKIVESLIYAGSFDNLGYNRKTLIDNLDVIINYGELYNDLKEYALIPEIDIKDEYTKKEIMNLEYSYFGFYLKNNPISIAKRIKNTNISINMIRSYFNKVVNIVVIVDNIKEIETKEKKEKMAFVTVSDEIDSTTVVLFPRVYSLYQISKGDILYVKGKVEKRLDNYQIIAQNIDIIDINLQ